MEFNLYYLDVNFVATRCISLKFALHILSDKKIMIFHGENQSYSSLCSLKPMITKAQNLFDKPIKRGSKTKIV